MLELTILKVTHAGSEALKLKPYICNCDIFGLENAHISEERAALFENNWEYALTLSRSKFNKRLEAVFKKNNNPYIKIVCQQLFAERKPIWHFERFSNELSDELISKSVQNEQYATELIAEILGENTLEKIFKSEFIEKYKAHIIRTCEDAEVRDKHIGMQLLTAEQRIRQRYPILAHKHSINYTIFVGSHHQPENYVTELKPNVIMVPRTYTNANEMKTDEFTKKVNVAARQKKLDEISEKDLIENILTTIHHVQTTKII